MYLHATAATPSYVASNNPLDARKTDAAFAALFSGSGSDEDILATLTKDGIKGMMAWKVKMLQKHIAEKALAARGLSQSDVAAMPTEQRLALEKEIMREVAEKLKEALTAEMRKKTGPLLGETGAGSTVDMTA